MVPAMYDPAMHDPRTSMTPRLEGAVGALNRLSVAATDEALAA